MSFCPNCRSPLEPAARFCANCGHTLPAGPAPAGPRPFAGPPAGYGPPQGQPPPPQYGQPQGYAPPGGYGAPPGAPGGYGAPPGAPGGYGPPPAAPPGYGAPPPQPPGYGAPGAMPGGGPAVAPAQADGGGGMKILGGCGIAGCLGAGLAAVVGVGLIVALIMLSGSSSSASSPPPSGGGSGEVPSSGSARDLIRSNVGIYSLVTTSPLEKVPPGVIDSVGAVYSAPDGSRVVHLLLVYPSESIAESRVENVWSTSLNDVKPGQSVKRGKVTDSSGAQRGIIVGVTGRNPESVYWNNRKIVVIVSADAPHAVGFEKSAPY